MFPVCSINKGFGLTVLILLEASANVSTTSGYFESVHKCSSDRDVANMLMLTVCCVCYHLSLEHVDLKAGADGSAVCLSVGKS